MRTDAEYEQEIKKWEDAKAKIEAGLEPASCGVVTELERKNLDGQARSVTGLTDHEQRCLRANLAWLLAVPPDMTLLRRKLKETDVDQQSAIRAALVAAAHADGVVKPEEVAEIEKVYRALGLDPNLVYSDLHAGEVPDAPGVFARPGPACRERPSRMNRRRRARSWTPCVLPASSKTRIACRRFWPTSFRWKRMRKKLRAEYLPDPCRA